MRLSGQFVPVKLNAQGEGAAIAQRYGVRAVPTIIFVDATGAIKRGFQGAPPTARMIEEMQKLAPGGAGSA